MSATTSVGSCAPRANAPSETAPRSSCEPHGARGTSLIWALTIEANVSRERPCGSMIRGTLPVGCRECERGAKMVLFVTGLCRFHCFYCPVSEERMYRDVAFADEMPIRSDEDVLAEARAIRATGAGITGGDPLDVVDRTCHYVRLLKREFGPRFHVHLYTMSTDAEKIRQLADSGLDELRFHVPPGLWGRAAGSGFAAAARLAQDLGVTVGLEVPLLPDRKDELVALIGWAESAGLAFVNLNELEFSEANVARMRRAGYELKHELSHGVKGADEAATEILDRPWGITVHYCSSGYKDAWQLRARIKRRAEKVARPWDLVTEDGTLLKGVIEGDDPDRIAESVRRRFHVPRDLIGSVADRKRVEIAPWILEELAPRLKRPCYLVEEYPTWDRLEVERTPL